MLFAYLSSHLFRCMPADLLNFVSKCPSRNAHKLARTRARAHTQACTMPQRHLRTLSSAHTHAYAQGRTHDNAANQIGARLGKKASTAGGSVAKGDCSALLWRSVHEVSLFPLLLPHVPRRVCARVRTCRHPWCTDVLAWCIFCLHACVVCEG
jgi:hypothetical protein